MTGNAQRIPNFIKARSPKRLRVLMLDTQLRTGFEYDWKIIFNEKESVWYAWFTEPVELKVPSGEIIDGE